MIFREFRALFEPNVRAMLDWGRLDDLGATVSDQVVNADRIGQLLTVWYRDAQGELSDWRDIEASPMTVADAANSASQLGAERVDRLTFFRQQYEHSEEPSILLLPVYKIDEHTAILLDSSHRAVASQLVDVKVQALVLAIDGPISGEVLPDLHRFAAHT